MASWTSIDRGSGSARLFDLAHSGAGVRGLSFVARAVGELLAAAGLDFCSERLAATSYVCGSRTPGRRALDEQPVVALPRPLTFASSAAADFVPSDERASLPCSFSPSSSNSSLPRPESCRRIRGRLPGAAIPDDHFARAVLALRDRTFERGVFQRMVFDLHRQALDRGSRHGPLGTAQLLRTPSSSSRKS